MPKPKDITDLRDQLLDMMDAVKADPRRANQAKEFFNGAGKVLASIKLELENHQMKGEEPNIAFLGKTSGKPLRAGVKLLNS